MKGKIKLGILSLLDIILINFNILGAYFLRFDGDFNSIPKEHWDGVIVKVAIAATIIKIICFIAFRLYSSLWKYAGTHELVNIAFAVFIGNAIVLGYIYLSRTNVPRSIFIITMLLDTFFIGGVRIAYRIFRRVVRGELLMPKDSKRVLIVGAGDAGAMIIKEQKTHPDLKSIPVAIVDDNPAKIGKKLNGVPILGSSKDIHKVVEKKQIDEIIIAIPSANNLVINNIFEECSKTGCKVKILPSVSQLIDETVIIQKVRDVAIEDLLGREPIKLNVEEICSYLEGQVVIITGGGGSIGSELCRQIASFGPKQLIVLDNYENNAFEIQNELKYNYPELDLVTIIANVREKPRLEAVFKKYRPNVVFHAAAHKHVPLMEANPTEAIKNNVFGTMNVAECADKFEAKRFVLISTDKAVNPTNIMGATKRIAEMIIQSINRNSKTDFVAVRFGNVLGSNGSVIPFFKKQIEKGGPVTVTHPEITRFFMTIPEAVQLVLEAGGMAKGGEIFVLDMGQPVKIYDLAKNLIRLSGFEPEIDIKIEFSGLRPGEKLYEELLLEEEGLRKTKNNKIYVAPPTLIDYPILKREIECLQDEILKSADGVKDYIKVLVPTYKTANNA